MLTSSEEILGYSLEAANGHIGRIKDIYFDDDSWTIRYIAADTGGWLGNRQVLLAPQVLGQPDVNKREIAVNLTREQIEASPPIMEDQPVTLKQQRLLAQYYDWSLPSRLCASETVRGSRRGAGGGEGPSGSLWGEISEEDSYLCSLREIIGYHVRAYDADVGHIEDFLLQSDSWLLRYLVVDIRLIGPGRRLIATTWVQDIDWRGSLLRVDMPSESIKAGPEFDPSQIISRDYESRLHDYYGRRKYWE